MTRFTKRMVATGLALVLSLTAQAAGASALEEVLQKGFPVKTDELTTTTHALLGEYQSQKSVITLVFYAYGMLRLADSYKSVNDYVNASEYAKLGFFWLDDAVDSHENDMRVRYLRARVDAWLPAALGRCVVTLADTDLLLKAQAIFDTDVIAMINVMRYRALLNCNENTQAEALLAMMKAGNAGQEKLLSLGVNGVPEWSVSEIAQVITPLMKGD